jgi:hypothetical protein
MYEVIIYYADFPALKFLAGSILSTSVPDNELENFVGVKHGFILLFTRDFRVYCS